MFDESFDRRKVIFLFSIIRVILYDGIVFPDLSLHIRILIDEVILLGHKPCIRLLLTLAPVPIFSRVFAISVSYDGKRVIWIDPRVEYSDVVPVLETQRLRVPRVSMRWQKPFQMLKLAVLKLVLFVKYLTVCALKS